MRGQLRFKTLELGRLVVRQNSQYTPSGPIEFILIFVQAHAARLAGRSCTRQLAPFGDG
jgi:hypothetical protein